MHRRQFLSLWTDAVLAAIGLCLVVPAVAYIWAPLRKRRRGGGPDPIFSDVAGLSDLPVGPWHLLSLEVVRRDGWEQTRTQHAVWVRRQAEADQGISVLSPICPHLGCPIDWHPDSSTFLCPCHSGRFDARGQLIGGPPPRGMDPLDFEVRNGRLRVRWQDFQIGLPERVAVEV